MMRQDGRGRPAVGRAGRGASPGVPVSARVSILVAALTLFGSARLAWADPAEVESLIAQGNELRRQARDAQAVPLFKKAFDIDQSPRTAGQLGLAELAAGYPVEAAEHLALALESRSHPWVASNRQGLGKMRAKARGAIGEVAVEGTPAGASVSINGRSAGTLPLPAAVRVPAGRVVVTVAASGYAATERVLQVRGQQTQQIAVALETIPSTMAVTLPAYSSSKSTAAPGEQATGAQSERPQEKAQASLSPIPSLPVEDSSSTHSDVPSLSRPPVAATESTSSMSGLRLAAWVTAGAAVVSLAGGAALQLAHNADIDSFTQMECNPMNPSPGACQDLSHRWSGEKTWSVAGYIGGGVLVPRPAREDQTCVADRGMIYSGV